MNEEVCSEFNFETKKVQLTNFERNPNVTFTIPVPVGKLDFKPDPENPYLTNTSPDSTSTETQHSVNVRSPFKNVIERNTEHIEKLFDVRMSLQEVEGDLKLISTGQKAESSINEMLNICRKSKVYNFYLCFPVRGDNFHKNFSDFQDSVRDRLGNKVHFEKRPHITLALLNLVTDSDIDSVVKSLQVTSLTIKSVPKIPSQLEYQDYTLELEGLEVVKYKGKNAKRSVLMSNVELTEKLKDIANEFQNSVNKAVNNVLNNQPKRKKLKKSDRICNLTESQLAPKGIYLSKGVNLEITFTDVELMDPKSEEKRQNGEKNENESENVEWKQNQELEEKGEKPEKEESESEEESYEYDTGVKNKFHVTLLRHEQVNTLKNMKFISKGHVACAELRPRGKETCNFTAYNSNKFVSFVGNRFDNKENENIASSQISGSEPPDMPNQYLMDMETEGMDNQSERFVFWI